MTYIDDGAFSYFDELTIYTKSGTEQYAAIHNFRFEKLPNYKTGDANLGGKIDVKDVKDVTAIKRHIAEYVTLTGDNFLDGDVTCDGPVSIEDVTLLQRNLAEFDVQLS